jgi:hypothetical protein
MDAVYEHADGCRESFRTSLFFVGAFGVNDYLLALGNKTAPQVRTLVPDVIAAISMAIKVSRALDTSVNEPRMNNDFHTEADRARRVHSGGSGDHPGGVRAAGCRHLRRP